MMKSENESRTKTYRVTLLTTVEVEIEVDAENAKVAEAKAYEWNGGFPDGWQRIGPYTIYHDDDTEDDYWDDGEMHWNVVDLEFEKFVGEPLELDHDEEEEIIETGVAS
jgi:hypothetical protein